MGEGWRAVSAGGTRGEGSQMKRPRCGHLRRCSRCAGARDAQNRDAAVIPIPARTHQSDTTTQHGTAQHNTSTTNIRPTPRIRVPESARSAGRPRGAAATPKAPAARRRRASEAAPPAPAPRRARRRRRPWRRREAPRARTGAWRPPRLWSGRERPWRRLRVRGLGWGWVGGRVGGWVQGMGRSAAAIENTGGVTKRTERSAEA